MGRGCGGGCSEKTKMDDGSVRCASFIHSSNAQPSELYIFLRYLSDLVNKLDGFVVGLKYRGIRDRSARPERFGSGVGRRRRPSSGQSLNQFWIRWTRRAWGKNCFWIWLLVEHLEDGSGIRVREVRGRNLVLELFLKAERSQIWVREYKGRWYLYRATRVLQ